jgi:hypothetical protein
MRAYWSAVCSEGGALALLRDAGLPLRTDPCEGARETATEDPMLAAGEARRELRVDRGVEGAVRSAGGSVRRACAAYKSAARIILSLRSQQAQGAAEVSVG